KIPKELDVIVMKCLAKNRDQRFSSADEMQRALHKFLYQYAADFNPTDLADYARDLFKNDIVEDRKRLLRLNDKVERLLQSYEQIQVKEQEEATNTSTTRKVLEKTINDDPNPTEPDVKKPTEERGTGSFRVVDFKEKQSSYSVEVDKVGQRASGPIEFAQVASTQVASGTKMWKSAGNGGSKRGRLHFATFGGLVLFIGAAAFIINAYFKSFPSGTSGGKATVRIEGNVPAATVMINGRQVADKLPATVGGLAAGEAEVTVFASGYRRETRKINLNDGEQQSVRVQLTREDSSDIATRTGREAGLAKSTVLRVNVTPAGEAPRIKVNGQLLDISGVSAAPVGVPLEITVERPGFAVFRKKIEIPATTQDEYVLDVVLREAKFGFLSIKTTPSAEALITVDGIEEKLSTPFVRKKLPVGEYQVKLVNTVLGLEKIVSVRIEEDRFSNLEERFYDEPSGRMPSMSR
ncbi:MAG TPA: PEGA domain-containing protein, partial [Oligoflexia bacterium]|nr:PEGA domain-containing protein [Oligoflexia bacterium]